MTQLRLGTRGSRLALAQSGQVGRTLEERLPDLSIELVKIRTSGDRIQDVPLGPHLGQSFFTKEIEQALLDGRVDLAVHSCKDLATSLPAGLVLAAVPKREDPRDALVSRSGTLEELPAGARVGTSSMRRKGFLAALRPDLTLHDQRGNVPTRVEAVDDGTVEAVVLAVSGLRRLGLDHRITEILDPEIMLPAAAQGALALQSRADDQRTREVVRILDHGPSHAEVIAERACLRRLEAGCQAPVGVLARADAGELTLSAAVVSPGGVVRARHTVPMAQAEEAGIAAAGDLLDTLGMASLRSAEWAGPPPGITPAGDATRAMGPAGS